MLDRSQWNEEFSRRFSRHENELRSLYGELYSDIGAWE